MSKDSLLILAGPVGSNKIQRLADLAALLVKRGTPPSVYTYDMPTDQFQGLVTKALGSWEGKRELYEIEACIIGYNRPILAEGVNDLELFQEFMQAAKSRRVPLVITTQTDRDYNIPSWVPSGANVWFPDLALKVTLPADILIDFRLGSKPSFRYLRRGYR